MYAVIETSGRQYRVELGSEIELDQLDAEPGSTIELGRVLLVADGSDTHIGQPVVDGARVTGEVLRQDRGEKIVVFKYRPKARRRVKHGHRADLTIVRVSDIVLDGRSAASEAEAAAKKDDAARRTAAQEAERKAAADQELAARLAAEQDEAAKEAKQATATGDAKPKAARRGKAAAADDEAANAATAAGDDKPKRTTRAPSSAKPKSTSRNSKKDE